MTDLNPLFVVVLASAPATGRRRHRVLRRETIMRRAGGQRERIAARQPAGSVNSGAT